MATRRTGKSTDVGAQQAAQNGSHSIQDQLQQKAREAGLLLADNFQAEMLVTALSFIQTGQHGAKTEAILEAMQTGSTSPLEEWSLALAPWTQPALPSSASDCNG